MNTITINDYVVSIGTNNEVTVTYKDTDITADVIGKNPDVDTFVKSVIETIIKCDAILEKDKQRIVNAWKYIDELRAKYNSLINK